MVWIFNPQRNGFKMSHNAAIHTHYWDRVWAVNGTIDQYRSETVKEKVTDRRHEN